MKLKLDHPFGEQNSQVLVRSDDGAVVGALFRRGRKAYAPAPTNMYKLFVSDAGRALGVQAGVGPTIKAALAASVPEVAPADA